MLVARRFVLTGHVQGVGFRFFAEDAASVEGLAGWVRNRPDGAVEVFAEGDREAVDRFETKLRRGPSRARVARVTVEDELPSGRTHGFAIRS
jgi:acylphosphatase